ncbi:glycosyltransferase [bacterium]|nr:MAG: glycosyltransferase [bacterium]
MKKLNIIIPIYNEERQLREHVEKVREYALKNLGEMEWKIIVVDNKSSDNSNNICIELKNDYKEFEFIRLEIKGKGIALRTALERYDYDYALMMDLDLSTDIKHIAEAMGKFAEGYDMVIGSRLTKGSKVINRSLKRSTLSIINVILIKLITRSRFHDFKCGFKAINVDTAKNLVPLTKDDTWFFDFELTLLAEKFGYKVFELPVTWIDDKESKVNVKKVARADLGGSWRVMRERVWRSDK